MSDPQLRDQVARARGNFIAMAATYSLGVFNDSLFRQSAMLLAVTWGRTEMQGYVMAVFTLPYILFASPAGWLADRFSKRHVVIGSKFMELAAILCGALGLVTGEWNLILAMVFTMGAQACLFSPAINGSIPELYPEAYVTRANATLKVVTTAAILAGISISGVVLSIEKPEWRGVELGRVLVALGAVCISLLGVVSSFGVPRRPAAAPDAKFPWAGPWATLRQCAAIDRDRLLSLVAITDTTIWFVGSLLIPVVNVLAIEQFDRGKALAGALVASEVVGVAVGGVIGSRLAVGPRWHRVLPLGLLGTGLALALTGLAPLLPGAWPVAATFALMALTGIMGGIVLVPCEAFVQTRAAGDRKGTVIASVNFAVFCGILLSGPVANVLNSVFNPAMRVQYGASLGWLANPTTALAAIGVVTLPVAAWLYFALAKEPK